MQLIRICSILCLLFFSSTSYSVSLPPAHGQHAMVVTTQHLASNIGLNILEHGGNAIDAAVAIGYALAVVEPCCGNIGGGGFMLIRFTDGKNTFINFREKAPAALTPKLFFDQKGLVIPGKMVASYLAVGVPGTVMGLNTALAKYGTMSLPMILEPAINLAKNGFILQDGDTTILSAATKDLQQQANVAAIFLKDGKAFRTGDRLKQIDLAHSLTLIAQQGTQAFYQGDIAHEIVKASQAQGGVLTLQDFAHYSIVEQQPITCDYRGSHIISAPPPSSGGVTLCEILKITEAYPLGALGYHSAAGSHYILEAMRYAYADRNSQLGDPNFIHNPIAKLLSNSHIEQIRSKIRAKKAGNSKKMGFITIHHKEGNHTTHFSVIDKFGNAVAVTYTLNDYFGAKIIAGNTGILLNNEMDDFSLKPGIPNEFQLIQSDKNAIAPNKRPLSSMTPTIITKNDQLFMVLGTPGGPTIITSVLQTIQNVIDYGMNLQEAVNAPRFHMQWLPDKVFMEPFTFSLDTQRKLIQLGYQLEYGSPYRTLYWGAVAAILRDPTTGILYGAMDNRRPAGLAIGY